MSPYSRLLHLVVLFTLLACACLTAAAQETSQYDRGTPPQHAAGLGSVGSYAAADLGTINLSNGALNFKLPIGQVGGRGFALPLTLNYSSKVWSASTGDDIVTEPIYRKYRGAYAVYDSSDGGPDIYQRLMPGWTIGAVPLLRVNGVGIAASHNDSNDCDDYLRALTKLTLVLPDKGEVELRDDISDGAPMGASSDPSSGCRWVDGNRGQRWHATDGSGLIFISDAANGVANGNLTGWAITADGTRYRFEDTLASNMPSVFRREVARATSVTDRHGNTVQIEYLTNPLGVRYTDQLGRVTKIEFNVPDPAAPTQTLAVLVTVPGSEGQSRYYKVKTGVMNQHYRTGISPQLPVFNGWVSGMSGDEYCGNAPTTATLLYTSWCGGAERVDDRDVLTQLVLPNERTLDFSYNEHGEVAEVGLPTGGKVQYDYAYNGGLPAGNSPQFEVNPSPGSGNVYGIDRAVTARRIYPAGQTSGAAAAYWSYAYSATTDASTGAASNGVTEIIARASDNTTVLLRQKHYFLNGGRFLTSLGGTGYTIWSTGLERRMETLDAAGANVLAASEQDWVQRAAVVWTTGAASEQVANDNRVNEERKILETGATAKVTYLYDQYNNPTEVKEYDYDQTLKRRTVTSYLNANNGYNYQTDDSIHLLRLPQLTTIYDGAGNQVAQTQISYDEAAYLLSNYSPTPTGWTTPPSPARGLATTSSRWLDQTGANPNVTNTWLAGHAQYDQVGNVRSTWDAKGNQAQVSYADSFCNGSTCGGTYTANTYAFPTATTSAVPDPTGTHGTNTALTATTVYDYWTGHVTASTNANGKVTSAEYDDTLDRVTMITNPKGARTRYEYYDDPATGPLYLRTLTDQDAPMTRQVEARQYFDGLGRNVRSFLYDGTASTPWAVTDTYYDALGRVWKGSNPYRVATPSATVPATCAACTTSGYDALGRVVTVTTPDGAQVVMAYSGNTVTVTDQAGKARKSVSDALGRLTSVYEDPTQNGLNYQTSYLYDALGNLRQVTQGTQQRYFMYDSLSRLVRAKNPEQDAFTATTDFAALTDPISGNSQWSMGYSYDANGNLVKKIDARNITTTYTYDALNRNTLVDYSNTTSNPDIDRRYDGANSGRGLFWYDYAYNDNGTVNYQLSDWYNSLGQAQVRYQSFYAGGQWTHYQMGRTLDVQGRVTQETYPSGHTVSYNYDAAGRLGDLDSTHLAFTGNLGDGVARTYAQGVTYDEASRMQQEQFGTTTALYHKQHYNVRGQLYDVRLSTVAWAANNQAGQWDWNRGALLNYYSTAEMSASTNAARAQSGAENNGNLKRAGVYVPTDQTGTYNESTAGAFAFSQDDYSYDALNRLASVTEYQQGQTQVFTQAYSYDRFGNRTIDQTNTTQTGVIPHTAFIVDAATNRLGVPSGQAGTMAYDQAGNLTTNSYSPTTSAVTFVYDAENRIVESQSGVPQTVSKYSYDGDGHRVRRTSNGQETWQVYGFDGELVAEYAANGATSAPQKEYGYRNGELLVTAARPNVASTANGGVATAQNYTADNSYPGLHFQPSYVNDGVRYVTTSGDHYWRDEHGLPSWLQIDFQESKSIDEVDVFTFADYPAYQTQADPTQTQTCSQQCLTAFDVQYWTGSAWATVTGGSVTSNNLVWKKINFTALTTSKIRVMVNGAVDGVARIAEVEAYGPDVQWLVPDQLGTPRMVADLSGSLTGIKRHDYLPFGEELGAGVGGRTTGQGYVADNVRQKFGGGKERDDETGLDYFGARYYSSTMGRFTSVDPIAMAVARLIDPQSINLYSYTRNNPLKFIDPTGQYFTYGKGAEDELKKYRAFLEKDPKKYKSQLDTLNKLDGSKVEYHLTLKNESKEGVEGHVSAELTEGGKSARVIINLSNVGGPQGEKFSPFARMAHELEHGRQFEDGEIGFAFLNGKYRGTVGSDASDEFKAFQAMLPLATDKDFMVMAGPRDFEFRILDAIRTASSQDEDARQGVVVRISQDYKDAAEKNAYGTNFNYGSSEKHGLISADKYVLFGIKHK